MDRKTRYHKNINYPQINLQIKKHIIAILIGRTFLGTVQADPKNSCARGNSYKKTR